MAKRQTKKTEAKESPLKKIEDLNIPQTTDKKVMDDTVLFDSNGSFFAKGKSKMTRKKAQMLQGRGYGLIIG